MLLGMQPMFSVAMPWCYTCGFGLDLQVEHESGRRALRRSVWRLLGSCGLTVLFQQHWREDRCAGLWWVWVPEWETHQCCLESLEPFSLDASAAVSLAFVSEGGGTCADVAEMFFAIWLPCCAIAGPWEDWRLKSVSFILKGGEFAGAWAGGKQKGFFPINRDRKW